MKAIHYLALVSPLTCILLATGCPAEMDAPVGGAADMASGFDLAMPDQARATAPMVSAVTPQLGPSAGGIPLQLDGQNFATGATVTVDGVPASGVTVTTPGHLTATLPVRPGGWGKVPVVVTNLDGQSASRSDLFAYYASQLRYPGAGFATGMYPCSVAVGDFNGDQRSDLAVVNCFSNDVSVLLADGSGGFAAARSYAAGAGPQMVIVGDFNGDKKLDLAVASDRSNDVNILIGDGTGGFSGARPFLAGASASALAMGDFNGDKKIDIVVVNNQDDSISVLLGDGAGDFAKAKNFSVGKNPISVAVGDANGN